MTQTNTIPMPQKFCNCHETRFTDKDGKEVVHPIVENKYGRHNCAQVRLRTSLIVVAEEFANQRFGKYPNSVPAKIKWNRAFSDEMERLVAASKSSRA